MKVTWSNIKGKCCGFSCGRMGSIKSILRRIILQIRSVSVSNAISAPYRLEISFGAGE